MEWDNIVKEQGDEWLYEIDSTDNIDGTDDRDNVDSEDNRQNVDNDDNRDNVDSEDNSDNIDSEDNVICVKEQCDELLYVVDSTDNRDLNTDNRDIVDSDDNRDSVDSEDNSDNVDSEDNVIWVKEQCDELLDVIDSTDNRESTDNRDLNADNKDNIDTTDNKDNVDNRDTVMHDSVKEQCDESLDVIDSTDKVRRDRRESLIRSTVLCEICYVAYTYDFYGKKAPYCPAILHLEELYLLRDPYIGETRVVPIAGQCTKCIRTVCIGCSVFYTKRFCKMCVINYAEYFPQQVIAAVQR